MSHLSRRKPNPVEVLSLDSFDQAFLIHTGNLKLINPLETIAEVLKASGDLILWGPQAALMFRVLVNGWKEAGGEDYTDEVVDAFDLEADPVTVDNKRLNKILKGAEDLGARHWKLVKNKIDEIYLETQYRSQVFYDERFNQFIEATTERGHEPTENQIQADVGKVEKVSREQFDQWFSLQQPIIIQDYINGFPSEVLNPRIAELATQATLKEGVRAVDRAELINRVNNIPSIPHAQFDITGDVEVARAWNKTAVAMMQGYAVSEYQVISERDRKTCPVCQRIDGRCFSAEMAVNKMQEYDGITAGNVQAIRDLWRFPRMDDVDNVPPEAIRDLDLVPPFHPRCRCEVVLLHTRFDGNVTFDSFNEIPMVPEQRLLFRDRHMQGWDTHRDKTRQAAWRLMGDKKANVAVSRHGDNICVAQYSKHKSGVTVNKLYNFGRVQDTTLIENFAQFAKDKGGYVRVASPASLREVKFLERHWFKETRLGYQAEGSALDKILAGKRRRVKRPAKVTPAEKIQSTTHAPVSQFEKKLLQIEKEIADHNFEYGVFYDESGEILIKKRGQKHSVKWTRAECESMRGKYNTHNHPSNNSFSPDDVRFLINWELRSVRAVGRQYRHEIWVDYDAPFVKQWSKLPQEMRAERLNETWQKSFKKHYDDVKTEFTGLLQKGEMTLIEANRLHYHEVWRRVSDELKWLKYERKNWYVSLNDPYDGKSVFLTKKQLTANRGELVIDLGKIEKEKIVGLGGGVNETQIVTLPNGQKGVFKPIDGERFDIRKTITNVDAPLAHREALSWEIDRYLGLNLVPETRLVKINGKTGSLQYFRGDAVTEAEFALKFRRSPLRDLKDEDVYNSTIFDFLIGNTDRHGKNWMRVVEGRGKGKMILIDNGYAFPQAGTQDILGVGEFRCGAAMQQSTTVPGFNSILSIPKREVLMKRLDALDVEQLGRKYGLSTEEITAMERRRDMLVRLIQQSKMHRLFRDYYGWGHRKVAEELWNDVMF